MASDSRATTDCRAKAAQVLGINEAGVEILKGPGEYDAPGGYLIHTGAQDVAKMLLAQKPELHPDCTALSRYLVAWYLGCGEKTLRERVRAGHLERQRIGRQTFITVSSFVNYIDRRRRQRH